MRLHSPAPGREVTSPFGWRVHPLTGTRRHHNGVDWGGSFPVLVAGDGEVIQNGFQPDKVYGFGYYVVIQHAGGLRTLYAHGKARSKLRVGQQVRAGDLVFVSGTTGASTGNHLHFEVRRRTLGVYHPVNPITYLTAPPPSPGPDSTEDDDMKPTTIRYTGKTKAWAFIAPWFTGGSVVTKDETRAKRLAALYVRNWGIGVRDGWDYETSSQAEFNEIIAEGKTAHELYVMTLRAGASVPGSVDLTPVLTAVAAVPTAEENGQAAREAIVK